ncbi:hypothetical protein [Piscinibacter gummiphilus]|uniref:hypothetical protein n=1 Tax=Piscinibacter gummiphilus TaxID=946333 RepID=UPI0012F50252|nr:hypothetical protein [Piscinibacter gummiphilus]
MSTLLLLSLSTNARAFQLSPDGTSFERRLASQGQPTGQRLLGKIASFGVRKFGSPVHEEISNRALDCEGDAEICADPDWDPAQAYILAGVRWNDDPPFRFERSFGKYVGCTPGQTVRLVVQPECWARVFVDGKKRAKRGESLDARSAPLLLRSHFGDMQFLHSMGGRDGESPEVTRARILMWSEFTWKVATQRILGGEIVAKVNVAGMSEVFGANGWSVQDLFTLGNPNIRKPAYLAAVAFGSLLHTVQDSFSRAHVSRRSPEYNATCPGSAGKHLAPGAIEEFHSYSHQDADLHADADVRPAFSAHQSSGKPTTVDVGRTLAEFYGRQAAWSEVAPYISCIFLLHENPRPASPGDFAAP